jgi:hypothetical protein
MTVGEAFEVTGVLRQAQKGAPVQLDVPVVMQTATGAVVDTLRSETASTPFAFRTAARPLALQVDPSFDLFRLLDPRETPASIGQIFGEPRILAVLPAKAPAAEIAAYRALVEGWRSESHQPEFTTDAELRLTYVSPSVTRARLRSHSSSRWYSASFMERLYGYERSPQKRCTFPRGTLVCA